MSETFISDGKLEAPRRKKAARYPRAPLETRFWSKVDKRGPDECWEWTGTIGSRWGYGFLFSEGRSRPAHRVSWKLHNGPIPDGMFICHHCDNRPCVNPKHLFLGSAADNAADMAAKGRCRSRGVGGEASGNAKLTAEQVVAIRAELGPHAAIAKRYGVSRPSISNIKSGRTWAGL